MKKHEGFTLVELLAVIVILAILITISVPTVQRAIDSSRKLGIKDFTNKAFKQAEMFYALQYDGFSHVMNSFDSAALIIDLRGLGIDDLGDYEGYVFIDNEGNYYISIHDSKNMIVNYYYENNTKSLKEVVTRYKTDEETRKAFTAEGMCSQHPEIQICFEPLDPSMQNMNQYINFTDKPAIFGGLEVSIALRKYIFGLSNVTQKNIEDNKTQVKGITDVRVVTVNEPPAGATNAFTFQKSKNPVWIWRDGSTLYFGTKTGTVTFADDAGYFFAGFVDLKSIDIAKFDFTMTHSIAWLFANCTSLLSLDAASMDVSKVIAFGSTFLNCRSLKELDVSNWDTKMLHELHGTFSGCSGLTKLDVSKWDVSNVYTMNTAFGGCLNIEEFDLSNWNTKSLIDMSYAFKNMKRVRYLNVSNLNTSRVVTMIEAFHGCDNVLELDVSKWDTRNLIDAAMIFMGCYHLEELDLSHWDVSKIMSISQIFYNCHRLRYVKFGNTKNTNKLYYLLDKKTHGPSGEEGTYNIIYNCRSLEYLDMSNFKYFVFENHITFPSTMKECLVDKDYTGKNPLNGFTLTLV